MLRKAIALAYKDFRVEAGNKSLIISLLLLSFILMFLSSFVIRYNVKAQPELEALIPWLILIYILFQTLNKSLASEEDGGCWDALCLCPVSLRTLFLGKFIFNFVLIIVVEVVTFPFFMLFFQLPIARALILIPLTLSAISFVGVGLLFSFLALKSYGRELLVQALALPLMLPALFIGLRATLDLARGASLGGIWNFLIYLLAFNLCFFTVSFLAFEEDLAENY